MAGDVKVGGAFIEIGGKSDRLRKAFQEAELVQKATLQRMGGEMAQFGRQFGGKLGLGVAGAGATLGAATIAYERNRLTMTRWIKTAASIGLSAQEAEKAVKDIQAALDAVLPVTKNEAAELATLAGQLRITGSEAVKFARAMAGLAGPVGARPGAAAQATANALRSGATGGMEGFDVFLPQNMPFETMKARILQIGSIQAKAFEAVGGVPGRTAESATKKILNYLDAGAEFMLETGGKLGRKLGGDARAAWEMFWEYDDKVAASSLTKEQLAKGKLPNFPLGTFPDIERQRALDLAGLDPRHRRTREPTIEPSGPAFLSAEWLRDVNESDADTFKKLHGEFSRGYTAITGQAPDQRAQAPDAPGQSLGTSIEGLKSSVDELNATLKDGEPKKPIERIW